MLLPAGEPGRSLACQIRTAPPRVCLPPSSTLATSHLSYFRGSQQRPYPRPPPTHASAAPQTFSAPAVLAKAGSEPLALMQLGKLGQTVRCLERGPQLHSWSPWPSPLTSGVHGSWDRPQARSLEADRGKAGRCQPARSYTQLRAQAQSQVNQRSKVQLLSQGQPHLSILRGGVRGQGGASAGFLFVQIYPALPAR